jgi:hypothetical protein
MYHELRKWGTRELPLESQDLEIMMGLLTPRPTQTGLAALSQTAGAPEASQVLSLVKAARNELEARCAVGDSIASVILSLGQTGWSEEGISDIQAAITRPMESDIGDRKEDVDTDRIKPFIHDFAVESFRTGQIDRAVVFYGVLLHLKAEEVEALSGLALCGVRLSRFDDALMLANECLKLPEKHPRAYCIAGFCELERGNRKAAQSLLALGARIARNRPEFAEDLRAAQRVLLILHFA